MTEPSGPLRTDLAHLPNGEQGALRSLLTALPSVQTVSPDPIPAHLARQCPGLDAQEPGCLTSITTGPVGSQEVLEVRRYWHRPLVACAEDPALEERDLVPMWEGE